MTDKSLSPEIAAKLVAMTTEQINEVFTAFSTRDGISHWHAIRSRPGVFDLQRKIAEKSSAWGLFNITKNLFTHIDIQKPEMEKVAVKAAGLDKPENIGNPLYLEKLKMIREERDYTAPMSALNMVGVLLLDSFQAAGYEMQTPEAQKWQDYIQGNANQLKS